MLRILAYMLILMTSLTAAISANTTELKRFQKIEQIGTGTITSIDWDTDTNTLYIAGSLGVWEYRSSNQLRRISDRQVQSIKAQPNGNYLAVIFIGEYRPQLEIWDVTLPNPQIIQEFKDYTIGEIEWSSDGHYLLDEGMRLWEPGKAALLKTFSDPEQRFTIADYMILSERDNTVIGATRSGALQIWDIATGERLYKILLPSTGISSITDAKLSPSGQSYVMSDSYGNLWLWDTQTWESSLQILLENKSIRVIEWVSENEIIVGNSDGTIMEIKLPTQEQTLLVQDLGAISQLSINSQTKQIASVSLEGDLTITDVHPNQPIDKITSFSDTITDLAWSPDGRFLATIMSDYSNAGLMNGYLQILDLTSDRIIFEEKANNITWADWQPHTSRIAIGDTQGSVRLVDPIHYQGLHKLGLFTNLLKIQMFTNSVYLLRWNLAGTRLFTYSYDGETVVWDMASRIHIPLKEHEASRSLASNPRNNQILRVTWDRIETLDSKTWQVQQTFWQQVSDQFFFTAVWSPDGTKIASIRRDGTIEIWTPQATQPILNIPNRIAPVYNINAIYMLWEGASPISWSPDGFYILVSYLSPNIEVYSANTGKYLATLEGHREQVTSLEWSPDGHTLASGGLDGTIILWDYK
jgi:WD40 repeat protein